MSATVPSAQQISHARERIRARVRRTPVVRLDRRDIGLAVGESLALKLELLQHTGSFKPRGAFNRVLTARVPASGMVAASGGNHGLAVAHVGDALGIHTEIFVPETIPSAKLQRLRRYGVEVTLHGERYDDARRASELRAGQTEALVVHAYDHEDVVAGAGTAGLELSEQCADLDTVIVAVGGGGLMAGLAAWFGTSVQVIAVEPESCPTFATAVRAGKPVPVEVGGVAADSLGAREIGSVAWIAAQRAGVTSVLVSDDEIRRAQRVLWDELRVVAEPGGATALACLTSGNYQAAASERVAVLVCGGNTDPGSFA